MSSANVRSIQTLTDLKTRLARFGAESQAALQRMEIELRRTLEWLDERRRHWEGQVRRCEEIARQAQAAVQWCHDSAFWDPYTGQFYVPDCSGPEATLRRAIEWLRKAQSELANVRRATSALQEAGSAFQRQAQRQNRLTEKELVEAQAFLERRAAALEAYIAVGSGGAPFAQTPSSLSLQPNSAQRGATFEVWAATYVFQTKRRISVSVVLNQHLAQVDESGLGLLKDRMSDNYVDEDGSLWDMKAYGDDSIINLEQLQDYQLMMSAGYVFDADGVRIPITSVNYLFSSRGAAEKNRAYLSGMATAWYVEWQPDGSGEVHLLEE